MSENPLPLPLVTTRHRADPHVAAAPPCYLRGRSMVRVCPIKARHFVAILTQMRQVRHIADTKNAFQLRRVSHLYPFQIRFSPCRGTHRDQTGTLCLTHTQPSMPMPGQADRIQRRHKCTGISCENVNSRVNPLTTAKLTRSCAGPNPGAIKYMQFTTDIALEETERCKRIALEHHKRHRMRTSGAHNVGGHAKTSGKAARDSREG